MPTARPATTPAISSRPHPYASFVHRVQKPSRYIGGEFNEVRKDWASVDATMCLGFPDVYDVGMSHLGTKILYSVLNAKANIAAERTFAPWIDMEAELRQRGLPLVSLESARPLSDFDAVGFSLQYEMTFTNVLNMLELGGIALRSADRAEDAPLVLAGGPLATHPEPIAPFIDAIVVGDAEEKLVEALESWSRGRKSGLSRQERLVELARLGGIYIPALYSRSVDPDSGFMVVDGPLFEGVPYPVERVILEDLNRFPFPDDSPEPVAEAIFDRMSMEIARGCTEGCRFCQAGMIYRPVRERDPEAIANTLVNAVEKGGYDEVSLTALSTADFSCVAPLIKKVMGKLRDRRASLSVSSLRAYGLDDDTLDELKSGRVGGLTFAPEAGTQRMRDVVNKNVSEEDIHESAHRIFSKGWTKMKLYFMIGLPTEEDEDVVGIVETGARIRDVGVTYQPRRSLDVTCSVSSHVPKPHTPFQWAAMDSIGEIRRKQDILEQRARKLGVRVKWHDYRVSHLEGILARGDIRVGDAVEAAFRRGARFDGWDEMLDYDSWLSVLAECEIDPSLPLGAVALDSRLPWDHISVGMEDDFLAREYRRALKSRLSPPCGKPKGQIVHHTNLPDHREDERKLICYHCGIACDLSKMRADREHYLDKLGATERTPPRVPIEQLRLRGRQKNRPPERPEQGPHWVYRLTYEKLGPARLVSHLDLVRKLPRILRRAALPMRYSQGFNPKPQLSFGPALPLGTYSLEEVVDVELLVDMDAQDVVRRLNGVAGPGIRFTGGRQLLSGEPVVTRYAKAGEYLVAAPDGTSAESLGQAIDAALARDSWVVSRTSRKSGKTRDVDVRPALEEMELVSGERLRAADPDLALVDAPVVRMVLRFDLPMAPRPDEWMALLVGVEKLDEPRVVRTRLISERHQQRLAILAADPVIAAEAAAAAEEAATARPESAALSAAAG